MSDYKDGRYRPNQDAGPINDVFEGVLNPSADEIAWTVAETKNIVNASKEFVAQIIDVSDLTPQQLEIVASYSHFDPQKNFTAEELEKESKRLQLMIEFLQYPERFKPSNFVYAALYANYISRELGERVWFNEVTDEQIQWAIEQDLIRNVGIQVDYKLPDRQSFGGCVKTISAEINYGKLKGLQALGEEIDSFFSRNDKEVMSKVKGKSWNSIIDEAVENIRNAAQDEWRSVSEGGIGFHLPDWIDRI